MKTDEVRDRPLDSFGGRLPCCLNYIGRFFSYWQGRFAACTFVGGFLEIERPKNSWVHHFYTKLPVSCGELRRVTYGSRKKETAWIGL